MSASGVYYTTVFKATEYWCPEENGKSPVLLGNMTYVRRQWKTTTWEETGFFLCIHPDWFKQLRMILVIQLQNNGLVLKWQQPQISSPLEDWLYDFKSKSATTESTIADHILNAPGSCEAKSMAWTLPSLRFCLFEYTVALNTVNCRYSRLNKEFLHF